MMQATAMILAGGKSTRMGKDKAFLQVGKEKIIDRLVAGLKETFDQVLIVSNEPAAYKYLEVDIVSDIIPGLGPLSGMHAGLKSAKHRHSLVMACDMPFINIKLGKMLVEEVPGFDVVVPQVGAYLQPLFAVYDKSCIQPIEECLKNSISKTTALYPKVRVKYISQEKIAAVADLDMVFLNINTPEELEKAQKADKSEGNA